MCLAPVSKGSGCAGPCSGSVLKFTMAGSSFAGIAGSEALVSPTHPAVLPQRPDNRILRRSCLRFAARKPGVRDRGIDFADSDKIELGRSAMPDAMGGLEEVFCGQSRQSISEFTGRAALASMDYPRQS